MESFRRLHADALRELQFDAVAEGYDADDDAACCETPRTPRTPAPPASPTKAYLKAILSRTSNALSAAGFERRAGGSTPRVGAFSGGHATVAGTLPRRHVTAASHAAALRRCGTLEHEAGAVRAATSRHGGKAEACGGGHLRRHRRYSC